MRESKLETRIKDYAKSKGFLTYKFKSPGQAGVMDRIFIKNGNILFIEFKAEGKELRKLQYKMYLKFKQQGMNVFTVDNYDEGVKIIDRYA